MFLFPSGFTPCIGYSWVGNMKTGRFLSFTSKQYILTIVGTLSIFLASTSAESESESGLLDDYFDLALKLVLKLYKYSEEEPLFEKNVKFVTENVEKWSFAYEGGEAATKRSKSQTLTWAIGIEGIDFFGKTNEKVTAMGALITPRILVTLCASVNSFYKSYKGVLYEERASNLIFEVSNTSDPQFDIRSPELVAYWSSIYAFRNKSDAPRNVLYISKHILTTVECTSAVDGKHVNKTIQQYIVPAYLLLTEPVANPLDPNLPPHLTNFLKPDPDDEVSDEYRKRPKYPLEMMAYRQRQCNWDPMNIAPAHASADFKVWKMPAEEGGAIVNPQHHLLITRWSESSSELVRLEGPKPWTWVSLKDCDFFPIDKFDLAYDDVVDPKTRQPSQNAKEFRTALVEAFNKPQVGCLQWNYGNLCGAPPGSPVFYWTAEKTKGGKVTQPEADNLVALTITSTTKRRSEAAEDMRVLVMMVTHEADRAERVEEVKALIEYVQNLGRTRLLATDYPTDHVEETEKITLDIIPFLDVDVVGELLKNLKQITALGPDFYNVLSRAGKSGLSTTTNLLILSGNVLSRLYYAVQNS